MNDDVLFEEMNESNEAPHVNGVPDGNPEKPIPQSCRTALREVVEHTRTVMLDDQPLVTFQLLPPFEMFADGGYLTARGQVALVHALIVRMVEMKRIEHTATIEDVLFNLDLALLAATPPW